MNVLSLTSCFAKPKPSQLKPCKHVCLNNDFAVHGLKLSAHKLLLPEVGFIMTSVHVHQVFEYILSRIATAVGVI